jgi:hypothetical protein
LQGSTQTEASRQTSASESIGTGDVGWWPIVTGRLLWLVPTLLAMVVTATSVPSVITPDGYAYLMGSDVIGTSDMPDLFPWYREPLYPWLLSMLNEFVGSTDMALLLVQSAALGIAATLIASAFLPNTRRSVVVLLASLMACSPINIGYAGTVLQQTWFLLALATYTWLIAWAWRTRPSRSWLAFVFALPLISFWVHLGQQMVYIGAPLGVGIAAGYLHRYLSRDGDAEGLPSVFARFRARGARAAVGVVLAGLVASLFTVWGSASLKPWEDYKAQGIAKRSSGALYLTDIGLSVNVVKDLILNDPGTFLSHVPAVGRAILSLGPSTWPPLQGAQENDVIIGHAFSADEFRCGVNLPTTAAPDVARAGAVLEQNCRSKLGHGLMAEAMPLGHLLTRVSGFLFLAAPFVLLLLRRWRSLTLMLVPYTFFALYLALSAGIDRYGMPLYPFGIAAGAAALAAVAEDLRGRRGGLTRDPLAGAE